MLEEVRAGWPSYVSNSLEKMKALTDEELSERMSGNLCRCAAYPNIIRAIHEAADNLTEDDLSEEGQSIKEGQL